MTEAESGIVFLTVEEVRRIHHDQLVCFGGEDGLRDPNMLQSAVYQPQQTFGGEFVYDSIFAMAAAYWHGLTQNHPFVDGNKRTGFLAGFLFLSFNGYELDLTVAQAIDVSLKVAQGEMPREILAKIVASAIKPEPT